MDRWTTSDTIGLVLFLIFLALAARTLANA